MCVVNGNIERRQELVCHNAKIELYANPEEDLMSDHMKRNNDNRAGKPIETASATTSPDNSDSGNFAFVLTALTLIVTIILSVVAGGVAAVVLGVAASSANGTSTSMNLEMDGDIGSGDMCGQWEVESGYQHGAVRIESSMGARYAIPTMSMRMCWNRQSEQPSTEWKKHWMRSKKAVQ
jgi:hypothetical protein